MGRRARGRRGSIMLAGLAAAMLALTSCAGSMETSGQEGSDEDPAAGDLSGTLTVFAAASLAVAFETLTDEFQAKHPGVDVGSLTFDGSSTLATQLVEGARADVFASADERNMRLVDDAGLLAAPAEIFATNTLVITVAPGNPLGITALADLAQPAADGSLPIVVMCAPEVPCGAAASRLLDRADVQLDPASEEQNVAAVLTKVRMGEADAGLVYRSDALGASDDVDTVDIEDATEDPNRYPIARLSVSEHPEVAQAFIDFVRSPRGQAVLERLGFGAP